jgi:hypothetical protein
MSSDETSRSMSDQEWKDLFNQRLDDILRVICSSFSLLVIFEFLMFYFTISMIYLQILLPDILSIFPLRFIVMIFTVIHLTIISVIIFSFKVICTSTESSSKKKKE